MIVSRRTLDHYEPSAQKWIGKKVKDEKAQNQRQNCDVCRRGGPYTEYLLVPEGFEVCLALRFATCLVGWGTDPSSTGCHHRHRYVDGHHVGHSNRHRHRHIVEELARGQPNNTAAEDGGQQIHVSNIANSGPPLYSRRRNKCAAFNKRLDVDCCDWAWLKYRFLPTLKTLL